jgi:hypothetical protein
MKWITDRRSLTAPGQALRPTPTCKIVSSCHGQRFEKMVINRRVIPSRSVAEE